VLRTIPGYPSKIARHLAAFDEIDCVFVIALHDALVEYRIGHLANHFATEEMHAGRRPGPGQCWALRCLLGTWTRRHMLLGTPTASEWLGLNTAQFRRLVSALEIEPEDWYCNPHYRSGPRCPLWSPEIVARLYDSPEVIAARGRHRGAGR